MREATAGVYLYGIVPATEPVQVSAPGVGRDDDHGGVRRVAHGAIAALASDLETERIGRARDLRAHWRVLEEATARTTVLPIRFGAVMDSDDAVRDEFLAPNEPRLAALLEELDGLVQLSVKGSYAEDRLLEEIVRTSPAIAGLRERVRDVPADASYYDRIRLGELVAAEVERRREADAALVLDRLEPLAERAAADAPAGGDGAVNAAFLVRRDAVDAFSAAVARLGEEVEGRLRLRYLGPLPPYSFAGEETGPGAAQWA